MDYDSSYSKKEFYWGLKPHKLVIESTQYLPTCAKVLDLGSGEGKNSFFLAKNGLHVTAVDISEVGIRKTEEFSQKEELKIRTEASDAQSYLKDCHMFDAIFAINVLQFIDEENIFETIKLMKSKTEPKGLNIIESFVADSPEQKAAALSKGRYKFDEGELRELYKEWKILLFEERLTDWETHGEPKHRHYIVSLIAQKS